MRIRSAGASAFATRIGTCANGLSPHDVEDVRRQVQRLQHRQRRRVQREIQVQRQTRLGIERVDAADGAGHSIQDLLGEAAEVQVQPPRSMYVGDRPAARLLTRVNGLGHEARSDSGWYS